MADCIDRVLEKFPEADRKDLQAIYDRMSAIKQEGFLNDFANGDKSFMEKSQKMLKRYRSLVMIAKARALGDENKLVLAKRYANNPSFKPSKLSGVSAYANGLQAYYSGTHRNIPGARRSIDVVAGGIRAQQLGHFLSRVEELYPGAEAILMSGTKDAEIGRARWYLAHGKELPKDTPADIAAIARAWQELGDLQLQTANDAGAYIARREGHMMIRSYDPVKIVADKEGFKAWMLENLDYKKSFERDFHTLDPEKTIDALINDIENRKLNLAYVNDTIGGIKVIGAPSNLAKNMEMGRKFEFKNSDAEIEFMKNWSRHNTVAETIGHSIRESARRASLVERLGSNPEAMHKRLTDGLSDTDKKMLNRHFNVISGKSDIPGDDPISHWLRSARQITDMGSLGYSTLRSFPDIGTAAGTVRVGNKNFIENQFDMVTSFANNLTKEGKKNTMSQVGVGIDSILGDFYDRVGTISNGARGGIAKMHQLYFKLIGQRGWTDSVEAGMTQALSHGLAQVSHLPFSELNKTSALVFQKYGVGPVEWDVIRAAVDSVDDIGFVGVGAVRELSDTTVSQIMKAGGVSGDPGRFKRKAAQYLSEYFRDRVDIGLNRAGAFEKASFLNRGWSENTAEGRAIRLIAHFKSYSYTTVTKFSQAYYHEALAGKSLGEGVMTIAPLMVTLTAMGYAGQVAWDIAHNRTPTPVNANSMAEAMIRGGVGGVYGDLLIGNWDSRHGRDALSFLVGPEIGKTKDFFDLVSDFRQAGLERDPSKIRASAISRFMFNIFPGNLPVVRQAMDYAFLNNLAESLNPGYNERMRARLAKQGQSNLIDMED